MIGYLPDGTFQLAKPLRTFHSSVDIKKAIILDCFNKGLNY